MILCLCQLTTLLRIDWTEIADLLLPKEEMYYHRGTYLRTCSVVETNIQRHRFRRRWKSQYRGSCGGPACPVMMNSMGFPLRWQYSIRTDTGFFPPGRERDRGWRDPTVSILSTPLDPNIPLMFSTVPCYTAKETVKRPWIQFIKVCSALDYKTKDALPLLVIHTINSGLIAHSWMEVVFPNLKCH